MELSCKHNRTHNITKLIDHAQLHGKKKGETLSL